MKKFFLIVLVIIGILIFLGIGGYLIFKNYYNNSINYTSGSEQEIVKIEITQGSSVEKIGSILIENQLINDISIFKLYLKENKLSDKLKAGKYEFRRSQNLKEIVDELIKGAVAKGVQIKILEGWRYEKVASEIALKHDNISEQKLISIIQKPDDIAFSQEIKEFLDTHKPEKKTLEGFLYPDTYEFAKDADEKSIIEKLLLNFKNKTQELIVESDFLSRTFYENLILASIIEKESFTNEERPLIAGVFVNRLEIDMPLQSDATVNYITKKNDAQALISDTQIDNPYNTYKYAGLPPAPINSPRIESIKAAVKPESTKYMYFLHEQTGTGQVHFAETFAQHEQNKSKYLD